MGDLKIEVLCSDWNDYALLDSGDRLKLERFGNITLIRSEPKAWWSKSNPKLWDSADCRYFDDDKKNSRWVFFKKINAPVLEFGGVKFLTKFMDGSKHLGVFPEQSCLWNFVKNFSQKTLENAEKKSIKTAAKEEKKLLNLFGYTGAASLVAARAGYSVVHVDASKPSVDWARKNQFESKMENLPIRWIVEDALKFAEREARRGSKYDAILLDPPAFGRGPKNELWKLEKMLPSLLGACSKIISQNPDFVLMTLYSIEASPIMAANMLSQFFPSLKNISMGELALKPDFGKSTLPLSIWARAGASL